MDILVVESDGAEAESLISALTRHGYQVCGTDGGHQALTGHEQADIVLLALELPDVDGIQVCRGIRAASDVPIIALTAQLTPKLVEICHGPLHIDPYSRQVRVRDEAVEVTRKEFDLLHLLASQPGAVVSRKELMARVWQDDWAESDRTIDTHVSTLRNKLGDKTLIVTVRGVGYRLGYGRGHGGRHPRGRTR